MKVYVFIFQQKGVKDAEVGVYKSMSKLRKVAKTFYGKEQDLTLYHLISRNLCEKEAKEDFTFNEEKFYSFDSVKNVIQGLFDSINREKIQDGTRFAEEYEEYLRDSLFSDDEELDNFAEEIQKNSKKHHTKNTNDLLKELDSFFRG